MSSKEKAKELVDRFRNVEFLKNYDQGMNIELAKECAIICVNEIINSNPHSNPFNTDVYSTMNWWIEVKKEIEK